MDVLRNFRGIYEIFRGVLKFLRNSGNLRGDYRDGIDPEVTAAAPAEQFRGIPRKVFRGRELRNPGRFPCMCSLVFDLHSLVFNLHSVVLFNLYSRVYNLCSLVLFILCILLYLICIPLYYSICIPLYLICVPLYLICIPLFYLICIPLYLICIPLYLMRIPLYLNLHSLVFDLYPLVFNLYSLVLFNGYSLVLPSTHLQPCSRSTPTYCRFLAHIPRKACPNGPSENRLTWRLC